MPHELSGWSGTHVPGNLIHRERTPPGEPVEAVVVRIGRGPALVNVDDPTG